VSVASNKRKNVIDSSSLGKYVNRENNWEQVGKQLLPAEGEEAGCTTLQFSIYEVGNSVWKRVQRKEIPQDAALLVFGQFVKSILEDNLVAIEQLDADLANKSFRTAIDCGHTIYDCAFIELAHKLKIGLITSDEKQRDIAKDQYHNLPVTLIR